MSTLSIPATDPVLTSTSTPRFQKSDGEEERLPPWQEALLVGFTTLILAPYGPLPSARPLAACIMQCAPLSITPAPPPLLVSSETSVSLPCVDARPGSSSSLSSTR